MFTPEGRVQRVAYYQTPPDDELAVRSAGRGQHLPAGRPARSNAASVEDDPTLDSNTFANAADAGRR